MNILVRFKTLRLIGAFGAICVMFAAGAALTHGNGEAGQPMGASAAAMAGAGAGTSAGADAGGGADAGTGADAEAGAGAGAGVGTGVGVGVGTGTGAGAGAGTGAGAGVGVGAGAGVGVGAGVRAEAAVAPAAQAAAALNKAKDGSLDVYRIDRWRMRSQRTAFLEAVSQDITIAEGERARARQSLWEEYCRQEKELACEEAMASKGFGPVFVTIDENNSLTALAPALTLNDSQLVQISDILCRLGGCREQDIVLIPAAEPDLAQAPDLAQEPNLAQAPNLAQEPNLAQAPNLAQEP